jgi:hypothetical protein
LSFTFQWIGTDRWEETDFTVLVDDDGDAGSPLAALGAAGAPETMAESDG